MGNYLIRNFLVPSVILNSRQAKESVIKTLRCQRKTVQGILVGFVAKLKLMRYESILGKDNCFGVGGGQSFRKSG